MARVDLPPPFPAPIRVIFVLERLQAAKQAAKAASGKGASTPPLRTSPGAQPPQPSGLHSRDKLFNEVKAFSKLRPSDAK